MALPSLILTPRESRSRYGIVTPELADVVEATGEGWRLWRGTTNLIRNPRFISGAKQWGFFRYLPYAPDPAVTKDGIPAGRWERSDATGNEAPYISMGTIPATPGTQATASVFLRGSRPGMQFRIRIYDMPGFVTIYNSPYVEVATDGWTEFTLTSDELNPSATLRQMLIAPLGSTSEPGDVVWVAQPQLEDLPYATPYADGDMGAGYAWVAGRDVSESTREPGFITVPHPQPIGDLLVRYREGGQERSERLSGPGRFGNHGIARWDDGALTITTDRELELLGVIAYPATASVTAFGMTSRAGAPVLSGDTDRGEALTLRQTPKGLGAKLLLSPDGSHDQNGPVEPSMGSAIDVVPGQYGNAWEAADRSGSQWVTVAAQQYLPDPKAITLFIRWKYTREAAGGGYVFAAGAYGSEFFGFLNYVGSEGVRIINTGSGGGTSISAGISASDLDPYAEQFVTGAVRVQLGGRRDMWIEDRHHSGASYAVPLFSDSHRLGFGVASMNDGHAMEAALLFERALTDDEVDWIRHMPRSWDWRDAGTLTIPVHGAISDVIVRYREDGAIHEIVLHEPGPFGAYGQVDHDGANLIISTRRSTELLSVVIDPELPDTDAEKLLQTNVWRWNAVIDDPGAVMFLNDDGPIGGVMILEDEGNMNVIIGGT